MNAELQEAEQYLEEQLIPFIRGEAAITDLVGMTENDLVKMTQLGVAAYSSGMSAKALEVFDLIANIQPDFYIAHHYIGMIEEKEGNLEEAFAAYQRAGSLLESLPLQSPQTMDTLHDVQFQAAQVLLRLKRNKEAALYLLDLREQGDRLDADLRVRVDAYLSNLGIEEA